MLQNTRSSRKSTKIIAFPKQLPQLMLQIVCWKASNPEIILCLTFCCSFSLFHSAFPELRFMGHRIHTISENKLNQLLLIVFISCQLFVISDAAKSTQQLPKLTICWMLRLKLGKVQFVTRCGKNKKNCDKTVQPNEHSKFSGDWTRENPQGDRNTRKIMLSRNNVNSISTRLREHICNWDSPKKSIMLACLRDR